MNTIAKTRGTTQDDITAEVLRRLEAFVVSAKGYERVTTHIFDDTDPYLDSDTVFAVKDSLICTFQRHDARDEDAERFGLEPPFCTAEFDFVLKPNRHQEQACDSRV